MKKTFRIKNLDCAGCAARMERSVSRLDGVNGCSISFMTMKLDLDADDNRFEEIVNAAERAMQKVDREVAIIR